MIPPDYMGKLDLAPDEPCIMRLNEAGNLEISKYTPNCILCGTAKELMHYKGNCICQRCVNDLPNGIEA